MVPASLGITLFVSGLNYLVQIDNEGKLRWAKSGELVDTTVGRWKDAGQGRGIVSVDRENENGRLHHRTSFEIATPNSHHTHPDTTLHYYLPQEPSPPGSRIRRWLWRNFTPRGLLERLLRATLQKNTWIYVSVRVSRSIFHFTPEHRPRTNTVSLAILPVAPKVAQLKPSQYIHRDQKCVEVGFHDVEG